MRAIPEWRAKQIRRTSEALPHLSHAHASDLLKRVHKRIDSLRFQLWASMKEVEELLVRLDMGNAQQATKPQTPAMASRHDLFTQGE